jgi:glycosyltransferase involved in cell wall biosynthesis
MKGDRPIYIIVNAGTHPEPAHLAAGLASAGERVTYVTSASWAENSLLMKASRQGAPWLRFASSQLLRRKLPTPILARDVKRFGLTLEALHQFLLPRAPARAQKALELRNSLIQRRARRVIKQTNETSAVIAQYTCAEQAFLSAAPGTRRILMYPIAHHDWMHRYFGGEAAENPEWAQFLQGFNPPTERRRQLDSEIALADHILVPSTFVKRTFLESGVPADRIHVTPLGATFDELASPSAIERPIAVADTPPLNLLFAGQVNQRKGISYLLRAMDTFPLGTLQLVLAGPLAPGIRGRLEARADVIIAGTMQKSELGDLYRAADLLVLPSLADGFGLVAIEAMACGLPCIVTPNTFGSDVITHEVDGFIVPARDSESLAATLQKVRDNPGLLQNMGTAAANRASDFTWQRYAEGVTELVRSFTRTGNEGSVVRRS